MYKPLQIAIMFLFSFSTPLLLASCSGNNISNKIDQETDDPNKNDLISKIKDSINNKFQNFNDKNNNVFIAEKLHISDTNIQKIMNQLVNEKKTNTNIILPTNNDLSKQLLNKIDQDYIQPLNKNIKENMVHFKNIQTPLTIDKEITIFNVSDVSANKMFNIISQLRNQSKISQSESENDFYIYKLNLDLNLKIKMQKTNISHTSKLDIYLTKNLERYEDQQSQLTIALKNHLNQSKFDLNNLKLTFENINSKKDLQKK